MSSRSSLIYARSSLKALIFLSAISFMLFLAPVSQVEAKEGGLLAFFMPFVAEKESEKLSSKTISLEKRYPNDWVNNVFKDNILLTAAYLSEAQPKTATPKWDEIQKPFTHEFTLKPGDVFAFHDTAFLPEYASNVVKTTNAHYNGIEGFRSSGKLMGDGVCHFASLFYWAAIDAGIETKSPVNHDFAVIPEIDKKYGVSIYADPLNHANSMQQNLYIRNNKAEDIIFRIVYNGKDLTVEILKNT